MISVKLLDTKSEEVLAVLYTSNELSKKKKLRKQFYL